MQQKAIEKGKKEEKHLEERAGEYGGLFGRICRKNHQSKGNKYG